MRPHAEWKVRIQIARTIGPTVRSIRSRISAAALFVNVIARISFGFTPAAASRCATRKVRTRVLPEPAPATTSSGPSVVSTASRWAGLRSARYVSGWATGTRPAYPHLPRALPSCEDGVEGRADPLDSRRERGRIRRFQHHLDPWPVRKEARVRPD